VSIEDNLSADDAGQKEYLSADVADGTDEENISII
jgi:hypothetical protein